MKNYIIITPSIYDLGGAQLFTLRRTRHLLQQGFKVFIIISSQSDYFPLKNSFEDVPVLEVPQIIHHSLEYSQNERDKIIEKIIKWTGNQGEYLLESHSLILIEWGEQIAYKCKGRHIAYPLAELKLSDFHVSFGKRIILYKLAHGQLYGCTSVSLKKIFERDDVPSNFVNIGYDESEMHERCTPAIQYQKQEGDFIISTVTRLDKLYIEPLIESTIQLANSHPHQKFVLLIGGGSTTPGREEYLHSVHKNLIDNTQNLTVIFTGYIESLGKDLFRMSDVFVGMGTASINSISQSCIAIIVDMDGRMDRAAGIFGKDTNNFAYPENGITYTFYEKLEQVYLLNDANRLLLSNNSRVLFEKEFEMTACFNKLDQIVSSIQPSQDSSLFTTNILYRLSIRYCLKGLTILRKLLV